MLKGECRTRVDGTGGFDGRQYSKLCYNDIQPLYGPRLHVPDEFGQPQLVFPYQHGLDNGQLQDGTLEYPVLTGLFMWLAALFADTADEYLFVNVALLAPFGVIAAYWLWKMSGLRALLFAAAPALVLYAFHNWDLLAVAATVGGLYLWWRGSPVWAAVAFGVGAALKMYPVLFIAPLVLERWFLRERVAALKVAAAGVGTTVAINLPFALANFDGWAATYEFHRLRGPNFDNIWQWPRYGLEFLTPDQLNLRTFVVTALFGLAALALGWFVGRERGAYPVVQVSAALLVAFLLWNKVHSPQYALWLMPFFALVRVHVGWWVAYALVDLTVYVGTFRYFYDFVYLQELGETTARGVMIGGVWARAALLLVLFVVFLWSRLRQESVVPAR